MNNGSSEHTEANTTAPETSPFQEDRFEWRMPPDEEYTDDPYHCFERTAKHTSVEIFADKTPLPDLIGMFSIPIYWKEWVNGNIQKALHEFFLQDLDEGELIEVNCVLNIFDKDRQDSEAEVGSSLIYPFIEKFRTSPRAEYDFSKMTKDEFLTFRKLHFGSHVAYPESLRRGINISNDNLTRERARENPDTTWIRELEAEVLEDEQKVQKIQQANEQIIDFFKDLVAVQKIGRLRHKGTNNPVLFRSASTAYQGILDKYQQHKDLQELLLLAHSKANKVSVSLLNTLHVDFLEEGYGEKGMGSIRCFGADYMLERISHLQPEQQERSFTILSDIDIIPSPNYSHDLHWYYADNPDIDFAKIPISILPSPGTTQELFDSSITFSVPWVGVTRDIPQSTPEISMTAKMLRELGGTTGEGGNRTGVDRRNGWRLNRYMTQNPEQIEKYRAEKNIPALAAVMLDRPGIIDGLGRETGLTVLNEGNDGIETMLHTLHSEISVFTSIDVLQKKISEIEVKIPVFTEIETRMRNSGMDLVKYLNNHPNDRAAYWQYFYDKSEYKELKNISTAFERYQRAQDFYVEAMRTYTAMLRKQSQTNRLVVRELLKNISDKNIVIDRQTKTVFIKDQSSLEPRLAFYVINYVQANQEFIASLTDDDHSYISYLLRMSNELPPALESGSLTMTQKTLREFLGTFISAEQARSLINEQGRDERTNRSRESILFAYFSERLASSLTEYNFIWKTVSDTSPNSNPLEPTMAPYEERVLGIREALQKT